MCNRRQNPFYLESKDHSTDFCEGRPLGFWLQTHPEQTRRLDEQRPRLGRRPLDTKRCGTHHLELEIQNAGSVGTFSNRRQSANGDYAA